MILQFPGIWSIFWAERPQLLESGVQVAELASKDHLSLKRALLSFTENNSMLVVHAYLVGTH